MHEAMLLTRTASRNFKKLKSFFELFFRTSLLRNSSHYILNTIFYNCEVLTGFL